MFERLDAFLDTYLDRGVPGYDCIVYKDGNQVYRRTKGYADLEQKIPMSGREILNLYSCSKPITVTAALQLYEKGLFTLEEPVSKYMPEFETMYVKTEGGVRKAERVIRIEDLFTMCAGFSYDLQSESLKLAKMETKGRCSTRETMRYLAKEPLLFEPGERFEYSLCHDVLAALVEVLSGQLFPDYVREHIFEPLGMEDTDFLLPDEKLEEVSEQYRFDEKGRVYNCGKENIGYRLGSEYASGGAGCVGTAEDYIKFLEALRIGDTILKKETIDLMSTNRLKPEQKENFFIPQGYGYGLGVRCRDVEDGPTDFGWSSAAGTWVSADRVHDVSIVFATHVIGLPGPANKYQIRDFVLEEYGVKSSVDLEDCMRLAKISGLTY